MARSTRWLRRGLSTTISAFGPPSHMELVSWVEGETLTRTLFDMNLLMVTNPALMAQQGPVAGLYVWTIADGDPLPDPTANDPEAEADWVWRSLLRTENLYNDPTEPSASAGHGQLASPDRALDLAAQRLATHPSGMALSLAVHYLSPIVDTLVQRVNWTVEALVLEVPVVGPLP